jgi:hypothetical protein
MITASEWKTAELAASPLMATGGYQLIQNLIPQETLRALFNEAQEQFAHAERQESAIRHPMPERGGQPARRLYSAPGGQILSMFYQDPNLLALLRQHTGLPLSRTGAQGSYSYYLRPRDYLSIHRDFDACDVTLIITVDEQISVESKAGMLCMYPDRSSEPISNILKSPLEGAKLVRLGVGQALVLLGGVVPHWTLPIGPNENRVSALLCYKV